MNGKLAAAALAMGLLAGALLYSVPTAPAPAPSAAPTPFETPTASDFAYRWSPSTWGRAASYLEWWYFKVAEYGNDPNDPTPGVLENYFFAIEIVNPWDTKQPPLDPTTGVYVILGSMVGDYRRMLIDKHPLSDFTSASSSRADIHVCNGPSCSDSDLIQTDAADPGRVTVRLSIDTTNPDLVVVDRVGDRDYEERAPYPSLPGLPAVSDFAKVTANLSIERRVGWRPDPYVKTPGDATNPVLNWLAYVVDGDVLPGSAITWSKPDGTAATTHLRSDHFRAYADKDWGTGLPPAWIWGQAWWAGGDTLFVLDGGCLASQAQCGAFGGAAGDPALWTGSLFLQFMDERATPPRLETIVHGATNPADNWVVAIEPDLEAKVYDDREGWWQVPHSWKFTLTDKAGCTRDPAAGDRRMVEVVVSASPSRIFDVNITSPQMKVLRAMPGDGFNEFYDPFHDFEALEPTARLSLFYCDGQTGEWVPEVAPPGSGGWPMVADIGAYEYGLLKGRVDSAEVFASPVTVAAQGPVAALSYYAKNIGGQPAHDVVVELQAQRYDPALGHTTLQTVCTSVTASAPRGVTLASGEHQDGTDTLAATCTVPLVGGGPSAAGPACQVFSTRVKTSSEQVDTSNDQRETQWCPPGAQGASSGSPSPYSGAQTALAPLGGPASGAEQLAPGASCPAPVTPSAAPSPSATAALPCSPAPATAAGRTRSPA